MIAFTILGLLVFWWFCFEFGYCLAWVADTDGIVMGCARLLVGVDEVDKSIRDLVVSMSIKEPSHD